jgi:hypothetical protein
MGTLREQAEALGIEVDGRWSNGTLSRRIRDVTEAKTRQELREKEPKSTITVRLHNHTVPVGWYKVIGHFDSEETFVPGEVAPPPFPGVAFDHKLWAGTVVELPTDEAQRLVEHMDVTTQVERDPDTKLVTGRKKVNRRRPLAEVYTDWTKNAVGIEESA